MKRLLFLGLIFILNTQLSVANCNLMDSTSVSELNILQQFSDDEKSKDFAKSDSVISEIKHPKRTAAILALTLGMLGAHRLFLGSKPWVPLFYVLTVGGVFFILPLIDFIAIVAEKDTSKFYNNNSVLMWLNK